ncbi:hypothetical protein MMC34_001477 [Xylographa carneopallida]|nr:hypothetical protein [Xylographa carneopallida]
MALITFRAFFVALATLIALLYNPIKLRAVVLGYTRSQASIENIHGADLRVIPNTVQCEDLHHHLPSGLLFAACQGRSAERFLWFPASPQGNFRDPKAAADSQGGLFVIDPKTFTSSRLTLEGFPGPFITHGIDIYSAPSVPDTVYIFAINHLPNPAYYDSPSSAASSPKARSQVEIFRHTIGTLSATHIRSVRSPLIRTPNDVYATGPSTFYVTNDHFYREGLLRDVETIAGQYLAPWSDIVHVAVDALSPSDDPSVAVTASVAYAGINIPNGLGHGRNASDILIVRASPGVLIHATIDPADPAGHRLKLLRSTQLPCTLDNPSYYADPYASAPGAADDASGYLLPGLPVARTAGPNEADPQAVDPVSVWYLKEGGERRLLFQDDGRVIRSASTAVLVGIEPLEGGRKQAWLWVTGFFAEGMVVSRVDL